MATGYTGVARPPAGQDAPSAAPAPGTAVTPNVPADADPNNSATMFLQQYRAFANQQAWNAAALRSCPPILPVGSTSGFSSVTQVGAGTGTVTPSGSTKISTGHNIVVKMTLGGAVGAAKFMTSLDGGATYGAEQTTAASLTCATSGITLAFAVGGFVLGNTYQFHSAYTPQLVHADTAGNLRHIVDHNGYPMGRRSEIREEWLLADLSSSPIATPINLGPGVDIATGAGGRFVFTGTTGVAGLVYAPDATIASRYVGFSTGTANGNKSYIQSIGTVATKYSGIVQVAEWEARFSAVGANDALYLMGWHDDPVTLSSAVKRLWFKKASADTNWQWGTNSASGDTGVAPVANTWQRFRIELHGSATAMGVFFSSAVALFFINEQLVGGTTSGIYNDTNALYFGFGVENTAGLGGAINTRLGPLLITWNRYLSLPQL